MGHGEVAQPEHLTHFGQGPTVPTSTAPGATRRGDMAQGQLAAPDRIFPWHRGRAQPSLTVSMSIVWFVPPLSLVYLPLCILVPFAVSVFERVKLSPKLARDALLTQATLTATTLLVRGIAGSSLSSRILMHFGLLSAVTLVLMFCGLTLGAVAIRHRSA